MFYSFALADFFPTAAIDWPLSARCSPLGLITRPLATITFGHFGDKIARVKTPRAPIAVITGATFLACLPSDGGYRRRYFPDRLAFIARH